MANLLSVIGLMFDTFVKLMVCQDVRNGLATNLDVSQDETFQLVPGIDTTGS